jgi:hypothetical protein
MKTIVTGCATILGLVGALALTGVNCSVEQPPRAQVLLPQRGMIKRRLARPPLAG